jgi:hypothetical protein
MLRRTIWALNGAAIACLSVSAMTLAHGPDLHHDHDHGATAPKIAAPDPGINPQSDEGEVTMRDYEMALAPGRLVKVRTRYDRIERVYGPAFSFGASPQDSAEAFIADHGAMIGARSDELLRESELADGRHLQGLMYQPATDEYKFTAVMYRQAWSGVPVFHSSLILLTRNEADYPLVLASVNLRDRGTWEPDLNAIASTNRSGINAVQAWDPTLTEFTDAELVIWAGLREAPEAPRVAYAFTASNGYPADGSEPLRYRVVTDASTGEMLHVESIIRFADVTGQVTGRATEGDGADTCGAEVATPLPYARVNIGGNAVFADANGNYLIPNGYSGSPVTAEARVWGRWFRVFNVAGGDALASQLVSALAVANFTLNSDNTAQERAQVNAYLHANAARSMALLANPSYPGLNAQESDIYVNRTDGYCPGNAWYDPIDDSLNLCLAGSGYPNTAFAGVVRHEYGHHVIYMGDPGAAGDYHEGMADCVDMMVSDTSLLGIGFFGSCSGALRNANNSLQYPCSGEGHYCGQVLSGCVWETRQELVQTEPANYRTILRDLTINSILLHGGGAITPSITIDFLTLDDDDSNLDNGTPHYNEINTGFSAHNMPAPQLRLLDFEYPNGRPDVLTPNQSTTFPVVVNPLGSTPVPNTGMIHYNIDGAGWMSMSMAQTAPNEYEATLPGAACLQTVAWYVSAEAQGGSTETHPADAPTDRYTAYVAEDTAVAFADNFQTDTGWSVTGSVDDGQWGRGLPIDCGRGDPESDFDGSGICYLTDNSAGSGCNSDVDSGTTNLESPAIDLTDRDGIISYAIWYTNNEGDNPNNDTFNVFVSNNGGSSWTLVQTIGPVTPLGWNEHSFRVSDFVTPTAQVRVRFSASDLGGGSIVEAGVDAFNVTSIDCTPQILCPADVFPIGGDGLVGTDDFFYLLQNWGPCEDPGDCRADLMPADNPDGVVGTDDFFSLLQSWGPCE